MKNILLILIIALLANPCFSQIAITSDTVKIGSVDGSGHATIYGKTFLKNITPGSANDSILLRDINGVIKYMPRSTFSSTVVANAIVAYLQSLSGYASRKYWDLI